MPIDHPAPSPTPPLSNFWHDAFYRLTPVDDPRALADALRSWAQGLTGCLWVAPEGLNGVLAGSAGSLAEFRNRLINDPRWGALWTLMAFKRSACRTRPFQRLKVKCDSALLPLPLPASPPGAEPSLLSPPAWRELIRRDDVVVLDNRNRFEFRLGRFKGAQEPQVENFRDFPAHVQAHMPQWKARGLQVAMYCTGGIRCDKTSAWLQAEGLTVHSLEGGILNYFASLPNAEQDWEGECFVFDNRIALDTHLRETDTTAQAVFSTPQDAWRLARALRLDGLGLAESDDSTMST